MKDVNHLNKIVNLEMKHHQNLIKKVSEPFWIPSTNLILIFIFVFILLGAIAHIGTNFLDVFPIKMPLITFESNKYQNLIAINTGIGAVLVGITFFVAQALMDNTDPDRARVLLYKSSFFPLLTANLLMFVLMLTGQLNYFILIAMTLLAIAAIISLGRTVIILIKATKLTEAKKKVFLDILKKNYIKILNSEVRKRIGNEILLSYDQTYQKKYDNTLSFNPHLLNFDQKYIEIRSLKAGTLIDIDLVQLEKFISYIYNLPVPSHDIESRNFHMQAPKIIIHPLAYSTITEKTILVELRKDIIDNTPNLFEYIYDQINHIFRIENSNNKEEARFELAKLKDKCLESIKNEQTGDLKKSITIFEDLIIELYKYMKTYGGIFAKKNNHGILYEHQIKPVEWLFTDLKEIVERGLNSTNYHIIEIASYMPISLAKKAIQYKDHLVFQEYIFFSQLMFQVYKKRENDNPQIAQFLYERIQTYIEELSDFNLIIKFKEDNEFSLQDFKDFSIYLLKVYQNLIKISFDYLDFDKFSSFIEHLMKLYTDIDQKYNVNLYRKHEELRMELNKQREQVVFLLGCYSLSQKWELSDYLNQIMDHLPVNLNRLTEIYYKLNSFQMIKYWDYDRFQQHKFITEEKYSVDLLQSITQFYLMMVLNRIQIHKAFDVKGLSTILEDHHVLMKTLRNMKNEFNHWELVIPNLSVEKIEQLINLFHTVKKDYEADKLKNILQLNLNQDKVILFKNQIKMHAKKTWCIENILSYYGCIKDMGNQDGQTIRLETYLPKDIFLFEKTVPFEYSKYFMQMKNKIILNQMEKSLTSINKNEFDYEIGKIDQLNEYLILSINTKFKYFKEKNFIVEENKTRDYPNEFSGVYQVNNINIPIYEIYDLQTRKEILILNKKGLGDLYHDDDALQVKIEEIDEMKQKQILENPPLWLKNKGDFNEQTIYLSQAVSIILKESFRYDKSKVSGFKIML